MANTYKDKKILVVCGGFSSEREISLKSGKAIYEALKQLGYKDIHLFDLTRENAKEILEAHPDLVYIGLHGKGGEDGAIQGLLEYSGIPYTGPGICSSAICMDKTITKRVLSDAGLPTPKFEVYHKNEITDSDRFANHIVEEFGLPVVFKSPCQGSSLGIVIINEKAAIAPALEEVFKYGDDLLAEKYVNGIEVTLPILGNEEQMLLPIIEISSERALYDYQAKYTGGLSHHIIPACIDKGTYQQVEDLGKQAYRLLHCQGLSNVDFIIDPFRGPMIIEINTLPGMTGMSLLPVAARYMGISFEELVERILILGFEAKRSLV